MSASTPLAARRTGAPWSTPPRTTMNPHKYGHLELTSAYFVVCSQVVLRSSTLYVLKVHEMHTFDERQHSIGRLPHGLAVVHAAARDAARAAVDGAVVHRQLLQLLKLQQLKLEKHSCIRVLYVVPAHSRLWMALLYTVSSCNC
jgi:hypothetical protein